MAPEQDYGSELGARRILVVGHQPHNAGKTTLCKALIYGFKDRGVNLVPFKPHSGIGYWSQFDTFQENLMGGYPTLQRYHRTRGGSEVQASSGHLESS